MVEKPDECTDKKIDITEDPNIMKETIYITQSILTEKPHTGTDKTKLITQGQIFLNKNINRHTTNNGWEV